MSKTMGWRMGRRGLLAGAAAVPLIAGVNGCGYLLYPERRGRVVLVRCDGTTAEAFVRDLL